MDTNVNELITIHNTMVIINKNVEFYSQQLALSEKFRIDFPLNDFDQAMKNLMSHMTSICDFCKGVFFATDIFGATSLIESVVNTAGKIVDSVGDFATMLPDETIKAIDTALSIVDTVNDTVKNTSNALGNLLNNVGDFLNPKNIVLLVCVIGGMLILLIIVYKKFLADDKNFNSLVDKAKNKKNQTDEDNDDDEIEDEMNEDMLKNFEDAEFEEIEPEESNSDEMNEAFQYDQEAVYEFEMEE